jgi:hypothetical protein
MEKDIAAQLWNVAHDHGHVGLELEFRLGQILPGNYFSPNVGKDNFQKLKARLDASTFNRVVDVHTVETIQNHIKHVSTISISEEEKNDTRPPHTRPPPPPFCMTKTKMFQKELDAGTFTARCSIAMEQPIPLRVVNSRFVRNKRRRRFVYRCWAFDLTEVVSNADVDTEETYEVEIELLDPGILFERTMDSVVEWGLLLVNDLARMMAA